MKTKARWAAHEAGHYLAARRHNISVPYVSIVNDTREDGLPPHIQIDGCVTVEARDDILLSGWAAEAFYLCRDSKRGMTRLRTACHALSLWRARRGAGWRLLAALSPTSDFGRYVRRHPSALRARFPIRKLFELVREIHRERCKFHLIVKQLMGPLNGFATQEILEAVCEARQITTEMIARNETAKVEVFLLR